MRRDLPLRHICVAVACLCLYSTQTRAQAVPLVLTARTMGVTAKNPDEACIAFRLLFQLSGSVAHELKYDTNSTVAFQAAWRERLSQRPHSTDHNMEYFVGFVEGRLHSPVPAWWKTTCATSSVNASNDFNFSSGQDYRYRRSLGVLIPNEVRIVRGKSHTTIDTPSGSFDVVNGLIDPLINRAQSSGPAEFINISKGRQRCYVAHYTDSAFQYSLFAIDLKGQQIAWASKVWAAARHRGPATSFHRVEIQERDGKVFVFGADPGAVYFECFGARTGQAITRFSSNGWNGE